MVLRISYFKQFYNQRLSFKNYGFPCSRSRSLGGSLKEASCGEDDFSSKYLKSKNIKEIIIILGEYR